MHPIANRQGHVARQQGAELIVLGPNHTVHCLDATAGWLWQHADGERSVDALLSGLRAQVDANADRELVFEALDRLADAELLQARIAPPSGVSRRVVLRRLMGAGALAALTAALGTSRVAAAATGGVCGEDKALIEEIAWLEAEQAAIADVLDGWVDEGEKADEADKLTETYLTRLRSKERQRKKRSASYAAQLEDATEDLAECKLDETSGAATAKRALRRKKHFAQRQEKMRKRHVQRQERGSKRMKQLLQREKSRKSQVSSHEATFKKKHAKNKLLLKKSQEMRSKKIGASESRSKAQISRSEQTAKLDAKQYEERLIQLRARQEADSKRIKGRLVQGEERSKTQAEAYTSRQSEQGWKKAGADDQILAIAQQDALQAQEEAKKIVGGASEDKSKQSDTKAAHSAVAAAAESAQEATKK